MNEFKRLKQKKEKKNLSEEEKEMFKKLASFLGKNKK